MKYFFPEIWVKPNALKDLRHFRNRGFFNTLTERHLFSGPYTFSRQAISPSQFFFEQTKE